MDNENNMVESPLHEYDAGETGNFLVKRDMCYNVHMYVLKCIYGIMLVELQLVVSVQIFTGKF